MEGVGKDGESKYSECIEDMYFEFFLFYNEVELRGFKEVKMWVFDIYVKLELVSVIYE